MATETQATAGRPDHLTEALRKSGALRHGSVSSAVVESTWRTVLSQITRLRLTYNDRDGTAPDKLILKTGLAERLGNKDWDGGRQEVAFYNDVASLSAPLVPRCFEAQWQLDTRVWHLLLEDLADTHFVATTWPLPPTLAQCEAIMRARARFQAAWWDDPRLGLSVGSWADAEAGATERNLQRFDEQLKIFADRVGDRLPRARRDLFERLIDAGPRLHARYRSHRHMTVVQGDSHFWNCFLPKSGDNDVRLFDWDCWRIDVGSEDLAYMIAMHWYPDRRRQMERPLLDCFHEALMAHGVKSYDRQALDDDYRLSALWQIWTPVWQANANIPPVIWWNNLERSFMAVVDLGCRDLLT